MVTSIGPSFGTLWPLTTNRTSDKPGFAAVLIAERYVGRSTREVATAVGIDQWRADAYSDRLCACFVSGVLRAAGCQAVDPNVTVYPFRVPGASMDEALLAAGWFAVSPAEAQPGDVALFDIEGSTLGHVELVARAAQRDTLTLVGSNNVNGLTQPQVVSVETRPLSSCRQLRVLRAPEQ